MELDQGDHYEEETMQEDGIPEIEYVESEKESLIQKHKTKLILIAAGLGLIILLYLIFAFSGKKTEEPEAEVEEEPYVFEYSSEEREALREAGYTGTEIENFQAQEYSSAQLVQEARDKQREFLMETYRELSEDANKTTSTAYKELEKNSFLIQKPMMFKPGEGFDNLGTYTYKDNVDYEKMPARGKQTFIRIKTLNDNYYFMQLNPKRYYSIPDKGNMVVEMEVVPLIDESGEEVIFVHNLQEVRVID